MALIKPIHGEMKGSIGGNTWQGSRFGQVVRQKTKPVNPGSEAQQFRRNIMATLNTVWKSLNELGKEAWGEYAANTPWKNPFGDEVLLTGRQMFIRTNAFLTGSGGTVQIAAPEQPGLAFNPDFDLGAEVASGVEVANFDAGGGSADVIQFRLAGPFASSKLKHKSPWRSTVYTTSDGADPLELLPPAQTKVGQIYFVGCKTLNPFGQLAGQELVKRVVVPTPLP